MSHATPSDQLSLFSPGVLIRLSVLALVTAALLGSAVAVMFFQERQHEDSLLRQEGTQRVDQELEFLSGEMDAVRSDVLYLSEQEALLRFLDEGEPFRGEVEREYEHFAARRRVYDQIRFLDTTGREVIRINYRGGDPVVVPETDLQAKTDRYYYRDALKLDAGEIFISEFDLNVEHGEIEQPLKPVLRCLTPVVDRDGTTRGLLALNYSGGDLLRRLDRLSIPGATLLLNSEGQYLHGLTPSHAWGWLLNHSETFPKHFPDAWQTVSAMAEGQFVTAQGMFTFRHVSFLNSPVATDNRIHGTGGSFGPLILVAYLPSDQQHAASNRLLKQLLWIFGGSLFLLLIFGWYWARSATIRRQQASSIAASERRLRTLSDQLLTAQEQERRIISRQLHDELGQQVTAISLDLQSAARQQDPGRAQSLLERAIDETDHLLHSVHEFATQVRPAVLDDLGLQEAIESMISETSQRSGISVSADLQFGGTRIPSRIGENVYRILQEGLRNVVQHARAQTAAVTVSVTDGQLYLILEDQGIGFDPQQRDVSRLGILGMQERTELLSGQFRLASRPGAGTRIEVQVPLQSHPSPSA